MAHSNKIGNKSHGPILRHGQLKLAKGWNMTHLSILRFSFIYIPNYVFYYLHEISDWFSNIFPQIILHFLQPVLSKSIIEIGNSKGQLLKITLLEKPLTVLYTNGHISKSRREYELDFSVEAGSLLLTTIPKFRFTQNVTCSLFCGDASMCTWNLRVSRLPRIFKQDE